MRVPGRVVVIGTGPGGLTPEVEREYGGGFIGLLRWGLQASTIVDSALMEGTRRNLAALCVA